MPWTVSDVSRFKKGLSSEQKKKWVSIANAVLRECKNKSGNNCDEKAIRTANSQVNVNKMEIQEKNIVVQSIAATSYQIRTETHQGRKHIVVPVVMMVEGVHNGSRGPLFHSANELGRVVGAWNGIPITIQHPQQSDGSFISANSPDQLDRSVGRVFNAYMEDNKLKAEAWIDIEKIKELSPQALAYIQQQRPLDVSVGVFTDEDEEEGEWNGEHYEAIARNHRPDHLALLPGGSGACSWADGCGIRANSKNNKNMEQTIEINETNLLNVLKNINKKGYSVFPITNESGYLELLNKVREKLDSMDNEMTMYFVEEVYNDNVIYRVRNRQSDSSTLYQQSYSINDQGKVELTGEPKEVRREVSYKVMSSENFRRTKFNINKKSDVMNRKVEALIANTETKFTNCDREWLEGLSENKLDEIVQAYEKEPEPKKEEPKLDVNEAIKFLKENAPKEEDVLDLLSKEAKEAHTLGLKLYQEKKTEMIKTITDNSDAWTEDELKSMEFDMLEKVSKSVQPAGDYSAMNAGGIQANEDETDDVFLPRPQMNFAKK